jgi:hypothetical protein
VIVVRRPFPPITPGRITSLWLVLRGADKYPGVRRDEIERIASATSLRGGGLPIDDGIELAEVGGFLEFTTGLSKLSSDGEKIISLSEKEEPTPLVIRRIAVLLIEIIRPPWIAFANPDTSMTERAISIPEGWREVLENAGLFETPPSEEVAEWWNSVYRFNEVLLDDLRSKVGKKGEELTISYERRRLINVHRSDLADRINWVSQQEDRFGFDVASFMAGLLPGMVEDAPLLIEVKASTSRSKERIAFDLTRNEWDVAEMNKDNYLFYFWHGISPDDDAKAQDHVVGPFILGMSAIRSRIPGDSATELGRWTKCHIELGFDEVSSQLVHRG